MEAAGLAGDGLEGVGLEGVGLEGVGVEDAAGDEATGTVGCTEGPAVTGLAVGDVDELGTASRWNSWTASRSRSPGPPGRPARRRSPPNRRAQDRPASRRLDAVAACGAATVLARSAPHGSAPARRLSDSWEDQGDRLRAAIHDGASGLARAQVFRLARRSSSDLRLRVSAGIRPASPACSSGRTSASDHRVRSGVKAAARPLGVPGEDRRC